MRNQSLPTLKELRPGWRVRILKNLVFRSRFWGMSRNVSRNAPRSVTSPKTASKETKSFVFRDPS